MNPQNPQCPLDHDPTEAGRKARISELEATKGPREALEEKYGEVWDTEELQRDFDVLSFLAPFIHVTRKSDGAEGTMEFQARPRFYFNFKEA